MKETEIHEIASEYGVKLWFGYWLTAKYNGQEKDLMKKGQAYTKSWEFWHATFQDLTRQRVISTGKEVIL